MPETPGPEDLKNELFKILCPDKYEPPKRGGGKRKKADFDDDHQPTEKIRDNFKNEKDLEPYYTEMIKGNSAQRSIVIEDLKEFETKPLYVCLDVKEMTSGFDLKEEVILTMLN